MSLRAVFLDVGNTLVHEVPSRFEIYARAARRRGVDIETDAMNALMRRAHAELPRELDGAFRYSDPWFEAYVRRIFTDHLGLPRGELPALLTELFATFEDPATFGLYAGARELIADARARGLAVGVISNWSARLPRVLAGLGLEDAFDVVLCSALARMEKPQPEIFHAALDALGVAPDEALHAGDHRKLDVEAAQAVGLEGVLVDHARRFADDPGPGCPCVASLPELRAYILERVG